MKNQSGRSNDPLPRPNYERLNLPDEDHIAFWLLVIREYPPGRAWRTAREQSRQLYDNKEMSLEGESDV